MENAGEGARLRIQLLGAFAVWVGTERIADEQWRSQRASSLVKLLALAPGHRLHRDQVIDHLWPESGLGAAANSFYQTLFVARRALGAAGADCLRLEEGFLNLSGGEGQAAWVDVEQFEAAAKAAKDSPDPGRCQAALTLYRGDLLPEDRYAEWTLQPREALRQQHLALLLGLARQFEARQEYARAIETLQRLLEEDRANEEAHAGLMRVYALNGQHQQAVRQYQALCEALRAELDTAPGENTARLFAEIQSGAFAAAQETFPPLSALIPTRRHNLPAELTSFIGREAEVAEVARLVRERRLVTVIGAGGVGKTRLALRVGAGLLDDFPHGVWLAELAPLSDPAQVANQVAEVLQVQQQPGQSLAQALATWLRSRSFLLILDNCEHVLDSVVPLAGRLLRDCPHLHILATSRAVLEVAGETHFYCPSLSLPGRQPAMADLAQSEAVQLFCERAGSARPGFALSEANSAGVAQIVRRLDGIALAIELAAARARMLTCEQIAARLDHTFQLLIGGSRAALARHQTLHACIDWSYNLLSPAEQVLLRRLSVFAGGWTLEAAEAVCAGDGPEDRTVGAGASAPSCLQTEQILDLLGGLIDQSLIQFAREPGIEPRYRMLETVRQYALGRLASEAEGSRAEEMARTRHLDYFLSLALQAEPHLRAWGAKDWLDRLEGELDNLRQALGWSLSCSQQADSRTLGKGLQLAAALLWFWWTRGHSLEGIQWLDRLLQAQENRGDSGSLELTARAARGRALNMLGKLIDENAVFGIVPERLVQRQNALLQESQAIFEELGDDYRRDFALSRFLQAEILEDFTECLELFRTVKDRFGMAECYQIISFFLCEDYEQASHNLEESLSIRKAIGDMDGLGNMQAGLANLEFIRGNQERSIELTQEALVIWESIGNCRYAAIHRGKLVWFLVQAGDYQAAAEQNELVHAAAVELNDSYLFVMYCVQQTFIALAKREFDQAVCHGQKALDAGRDFLPMGKWYGPLYLLGRAELSQGALDRAGEYLRQVLQQYPFQDVYIRQRTIEAVGVLVAWQGKMQRAATLFGGQEMLVSGPWRVGLVRSSALEREQHDQALAQARAALGEEAFATAWQAGLAMTSDQVIQYALDTLNDQGLSEKYLF